MASTSSAKSTTIAPKETFYGFVKDRYDAMLLVQACVNGDLQPITLPFNSMCLRIRSGAVVVTVQKNDNQSYCFRWRDSLHWSASKLTDHFMLYRQVLHTSGKSANRPKPYQPNKHCRFHNGSLRGKSELIDGGLVKRSIGFEGSDGLYYRVTSYFYAAHVEHFYRKDILPPPDAPTLQRPSESYLFDKYRDSAAEMLRVLDSKPSAGSKGKESPSSRKQSKTPPAAPLLEHARLATTPGSPNDSSLVSPTQFLPTPPMPSIKEYHHDTYQHQHQHNQKGCNCGVGPLPSWNRHINERGWLLVDPKNVILPPLRSVAVGNGSF
ncbi:hypothetical protein HDU79_010507 [Rhizoclosmatium sp. JEL0117]|nr:hypothetical protein HDU79_010507 [Rhizoclosmatium sp. JEL0117]